MVGNSTVGSDEIGSIEYPSRPRSMTPTMSSEVAIGLLIKGSEMFIKLVDRLSVGTSCRSINHRWYFLAVARLAFHQKQLFSGRSYFDRYRWIRQFVAVNYPERLE